MHHLHTTIFPYNYHFGECNLLKRVKREMEFTGKSGKGNGIYWKEWKGKWNLLKRVFCNIYQRIINKNRDW